MLWKRSQLWKRYSAWRLWNWDLKKKGSFFSTATSDGFIYRSLLKVLELPGAHQTCCDQGTVLSSLSCRFFHWLQFIWLAQRGVGCAPVSWSRGQRRRSKTESESARRLQLKRRRTPPSASPLLPSPPPWCSSFQFVVPPCPRCPRS